MPYEPLHHKYRPQMFSELVGQEAIATTLSNALEQKRIAPAYLFSGPRGTGKTSSARILAKSLNCLNAANPTPHPCGECEVCRAIANGSAMDVIEIDAASNTGVDNIRELIERSQFAPVQCRYKVYVIDECLTGDSLVTTRQGLMRIDDPQLKGQEVLSFCETTGTWEYKKVLRWLDQGKKQTLTLKTANREIRCTDNHLIRTEQGWVQAKNIVAGMKILSPANVAAASKSTNMARMAESDALRGHTNSEAINTAQKNTIYPQSWQRQKSSSLSVNVAAANCWTFPLSSSKKVRALKASNTTGNDIPSRKGTASGKTGRKTLPTTSKHFPLKSWDWCTEHCSVMAASTSPIATAVSPDYAGHTAIAKQIGWHTNYPASPNSNPHLRESQTKATDNGQSQQEPCATPNSVRLLESSIPATQKKQSLNSGCNALPQKDELGGIWMMDHYQSAPVEPPVSNSTQKAFLPQKINSSPNGFLTWDIPHNLSVTTVNKQAKSTTTSSWEQRQHESGFETTDNSLFHPWTTNFETVESVTWGEVEAVYDIEVEKNHNFVANGLLVHNCHMLSVAAFNALLKTLEEPPAHVVFVLATTDPQRVLPTIISRCQRFDYRRIPLDAMVAHLRKIARNEDIDIPLESVTLVAQIANGGLRDAESLLDQLSLLSGEISPDKVWDLVGAVPERDLLALIQVIRSNNPEAVIQQCRHLLNRGREPLVVLQNLASFYLNLLIAKTAPQRGDLIAVTQPTWQALCEEANGWDLSLILRGQQHLKDSEYQLKNTTQPRLWLEITLLGLLPTAIANLSPAQQQTAVAIAPKNVAPVTHPQAAPATPNPFAEPKPAAPVSHPFGDEVSAPIPPAVAQPPQPAPPVSTTPEIAAPTQPSPPPIAAPEPIIQHPEPVPAPVNFTETNGHHNGNGNGHTNGNGNGFHSPVEAPTPPPVAPPPEIILEPTPEQTPPSETTSPTLSALEREQLWQTMLAQLQPVTTQQLLRQQGSLVSFNGSMALIGIKSQPLLNIAKGKQTNIEAAFFKACQQQIKVAFQVGHQEQDGMDFMGTPPTSPLPPPAPLPPPTVTPPAVTPPPIASPVVVPPTPISTPPPNPVHPVVTPPLPPETDLVNGGAIPVIPAPTPVVPMATNGVNGSANGVSSELDLVEGEDQAPEEGSLLAIAAQFAEFFEGEVIELTHLAPDDAAETVVIEPIVPTEPKPSIPEPPQPPLSVQGRPPIPAAPEDDIPF